MKGHAIILVSCDHFSSSKHTSQTSVCVRLCPSLSSRNTLQLPATLKRRFKTLVERPRCYLLNWGAFHSTKISGILVQTRMEQKMSKIWFQKFRPNSRGDYTRCKTNFISGRFWENSLFYLLVCWSVVIHPFISHDKSQTWFGLCNNSFAILCSWSCYSGEMSYPHW